MFAQHDERAHPSAKGGWAQPREWTALTRLVVGIAIGIVIVVAFVGFFVYAGDNADRLPPGVGNPYTGEVTD
jgi:hypothetical protein